MNFRTELTVAPQATPLPPGARVITLGSCFAAVLGRQLRAARLPVLENPFGTVLNPVSACRLLAVACGAEEYDLSERAVARDGRWFSYDVPSSLSGATPEELQQNIEAKLAEVREFVRTADALVLTMGTALAWRLDNEVVANCHKQPGGLFEKTLLSVQEIVSGFAEMHSWLLRANPTLRVILTVSPVRHPKETLEGSSVSKSTLRLACHHLAAVVRDVLYFPAYELLLDDLRDYRFFAPDLLHPSPLAEEYIFGKFAGAWFDARFGAARTAWAEIDRALAHRSANPTGEAHQQFLLATLARLDDLAAQGFDVRPETNALTAQLTRPRPRTAAPTAPAFQTAPAVAPPPAQVLPTAQAGQIPSASPSRPIKPIIRVTLPTLPSVAAPISLESAAPESGTPPNSQETQPEERRGGRRSGRRGRGGRDRRDRPAPPPEVIEAVQLEVQPEIEAESIEFPGQAAASDATSAKKRRGRRGGRRHKQRRDGTMAEVETGAETNDELSAEELAAELQAGAEAAAELAWEDQLIGPASEPLEIELVPAEEVALEATLPTAPPAAASEPESGSSVASARRPARPARPKASGAGGKKITLQKVKTPATPVVEEVAPDKPARTPRPPRGKKSAPTAEAPRESASVPPAAAPSAATPPVAPPTAPELVAPTPAAKPESRTARTPGNARSRGPVATPVEQATAARAVKKAGVGALLAALGGGTSIASPPPPTPAEVPAAEAAAAKPKRPAKPRTPKAK